MLWNSPKLQLKKVWGMTSPTIWPTCKISVTTPLIVSKNHCEPLCENINSIFSSVLVIYFNWVLLGAEKEVAVLNKDWLRENEGEGHGRSAVIPHPTTGWRLISDGMFRLNTIVCLPHPQKWWRQHHFETHGRLSMDSVPWGEILALLKVF